MRGAPLAEIVLVEPEIPWNAGNAGRSCLAFGARLHLVGPLGFSLDARAVRRAGLDYWRHVDLEVWASWAELEARLLTPRGVAPWIVTPEAERTPWSVGLGDRPVLVFGAESEGLPEGLRARYADRSLGVPMADPRMRSLNVSTTVGILLYEVARSRASGGR